MLRDRGGRQGKLGEVEVDNNKSVSGEGGCEDSLVVIGRGEWAPARH